MGRGLGVLKGVQHSQKTWVNEQSTFRFCCSKVYDLDKHHSSTACAATWCKISARRGLMTSPQGPALLSAGTGLNSHAVEVAAADRKC